MTKSSMLITPQELNELIGTEKYVELIKWIVSRSKYPDYENIKENEAVWIVAEWGTSK